MLVVAPFIRLLMAVGVLFLITLMARLLLFHFIPPILEKHSPLWTDILEKRKVLDYCYLTVPGLMVAGLINVFPNLPPLIENTIQKAAVIYSVVMIGMAGASALLAYNDFYNQKYKFARDVPIKTMIQIGIAALFLFGALIIIAVFLNIPILALASGILAIAAIVAFMFREPLLGLASSVQLSANHMVALGDWIEMDDYEADGIVEDINITSVKVKNWDNSTVNIPTYALIQNSFTNWQDMKARGARQIKEPIYIDQTSIDFATPELQAEMTERIINLYEKLSEKSMKNPGLLGTKPDDLQRRNQITNLELFMAYATQFIANHPKTLPEDSIYVRQQKPTPQGLPVETYFFTSATDFIPYFAVKREVFSHLLAVLPQFELRPYQIVSTKDGI
jgi:miniconductance mechanosensitive channel